MPGRSHGDRKGARLALAIWTKNNANLKRFFARNEIQAVRSISVFDTLNLELLFTLGQIKLSVLVRKNLFFFRSLQFTQRLPVDGSRPINHVGHTGMIIGPPQRLHLGGPGSAKLLY